MRRTQPFLTFWYGVIVFWNVICFTDKAMRGFEWKPLIALN